MITLIKNDTYLDYASATPVDRKVLKLLLKTEKDFFANSSSIYKKGVEVKESINESRLGIAHLINAHSDEIIFTGSGTESDALAVIGVVNYFRNNFPDVIPHVIISKVEHPAVLENVRLLENNKLIEATYVPILSNGIVDLEILEKSIKNNTVLISIMYANNEIGTIQPIEQVAKIIRRYKKEKETLKNGNTIYPVFHTDACQAMNYLFTENIEKLGVDLMTFNSSKIYGPKGIGVLVKRRNVNLKMIYSGGGQEMGYRSGTESISLIKGMELALKITNKIKKREFERLTKIRNYGIKKILSLSENYPYSIYLNGSEENRLPNNINISIEGLTSELLVIELSARGLYVSEKSACKSEDDEGSYVIKALRENLNETQGSIRITLGRQTKKKDMDKLAKAFSEIFKKYKDWK